MNNENRIKWTLLATLGWTATSCGGALSTGGAGDETSGGTTGDSTSSGDGDGDASGGSTSSGDGDGDGGSLATGGTVSATGGRSSQVDCTNPIERTADEQGTGFVACEEGYRHRARVVECPNLIDKDAGPSYTNEALQNECELNSDCPGETSYCVSGYQYPATSCVTGCLADADCGDGFICECGFPVGTCRAASCTDDSDCAPGHLCASDDFPSCGESANFACTKDDDACRSAADCGGEGCALIEDERTCQPLSVCGRPFLVQGEARKAAVVTKTRFSDDRVELDVEELETTLRQRISEHYLHAARMEHASIAAFARFSLQLLQIGAPADLIEAAGRAQMDETRHARLCFALANEYGSTQLGPGPLPMDGALEESTLERIVELCVREGCIGESIAAYEAAEAASAARDPRLARILTQISEDETNHAVLSFRFVSWALRKNPSLANKVRLLFNDALAFATTPIATRPKDALRDELAHHGVLTDTTGITRRALSTIVAPCAAALLETSTTALSGQRPTSPTARYSLLS